MKSVFCGGLLARLGALALGVALPAAPAWGGARAAVYQEPAAFLAEVFPDGAPKPVLLWMTQARRAAMKERLGEDIRAARVRYWRKGEKTAWILDEVGKEEPITAGIVVEAGRIAAVSVLVYRESRGYEIRYPQFRQQFTDAELAVDGELSRTVDGITGATLSVRAMKAMARRALFFHSEVAKAAP